MIRKKTTSTLEGDQLAAVREEYSLQGLRRADLLENPVEQFRRWLQEAFDTGILEPTAMTLATADTQGFPSSRIVLLKGFDQQGLVFYSHYDSRKGRELAANPNAGLSFFLAPTPASNPH